MKRRNKNCSAFSLLEVVIALAILTLCILPIVACIGGGMKFNDTALRKTEAASLLASVVNDLRSTSSGGISQLYKFSVPKVGGNNTIGSTGTPQQAFVDDSGAVITAANNIPSSTQLVSAYYCVTVGFSPPTTGRTATIARIMITWPPEANTTLNTWPTTYKGYMEDTVYIDLN